MSYTIRAADLAELTINETDRVKSVLQNVAILLNTRRGTVPLQRNYGISTEILHRPVNVAKTLLIADITKAINEYEPRAKVRSITFSIDSNAPDTLIPTVEVDIDE